jgi:HAD superfamily hydrolase (TIGR01484 family)
MRYLALACDYDGTLAHDGRVDPETIAALNRTTISGRQLVLVTGRELFDILGIFPEIPIFQRVVAENGAILYRPATGEELPLGPAPPEKFVAELIRRGVAPISVGKTIVATREPHQNTVLEIIHDLGLELQVIFNKGAVMVLPSGVNKATGLNAAIKELGLNLESVVGVGDAENDHAFLEVCGCSVAVSNALPAIKERVDIVTGAPNGRGVVELIDQILRDDLKSLTRSKFASVI